MEKQGSNIIFLFVFVGILLGSCKPSPKPITYGSDGCHFCRMTIVDRQHASQLVTKKGKVFMFDAAECMLNHMKEIDTNSVALYLVNDYNQPGILVDATKATYLISKGISSPMGEFLTAFDSSDAAEKAQLEHHGELYTWVELLHHFN